jgi:hypothetical protein
MSCSSRKAVRSQICLSNHITKYVILKTQNYKYDSLKHGFISITINEEPCF